MAHKTLLRWLAVLVITGLVVLGYAQYQNSVSAGQEAARKAAEFRARDAIDQQKADDQGGRRTGPGKGSGS